MHKRNLWSSTILFSASIFFVCTAQAQTTPGKPVGDEVQEVVVQGSFTNTGTTSAMKMDIPLLDTPFSVQSYTQEFMNSIQTNEIADLYRYMTGVQQFGATGLALTMRGFSTSDADRNSFMTDGLPGLNVRFGSPPTVGMDHIEIVKGAASLLYGEMEPGGLVNVISKKPQATQSAEVDLQGTIGGSDAASRVRGGQLSVDVTGPVNESGTLLYRFIGQKSDEKGFRTSAYENANYVSPMITWIVDDATTFSGQAEFREVAANYFNVFLLAPVTPAGGNVDLLAPIKTSYASPSDFQDENGLSETFILNHDFSRTLSLNASFRNVDHHDRAGAYDIIGFDKKDPTFQSLDMRARGQKNHRTYSFGDVNLTAHEDIAGIENRFIVGAELGREVDDFQRLQYCVINAPGRAGDKTCNPTTAQYTLNVQNPNFGLVPILSVFGPGVQNASNRNRNYVSGNGAGLYVSDLITWSDEWKTIVGLRWAHERQDNYADRYEPALGGTPQDSSAVLPQAGLIYEPMKNHSIYASYSTSFAPVPPGTLGLNNSYDFKPTLGKGYEVGTKSEFLHKAITFTTAFYWINEDQLVEPYAGNDLVACPTGSCSVQVGSAVSKGIELEVSAKPDEHWTVIAGYAYDDAHITKSNPAGPLIGAQLQNAPRNTAHMWTRYDFTAATLKGLGLGLGYSFASERPSYLVTAADPNPFIIRAYNVVDAALYYALPHNCDFTFKVNNLLDAKYFFSGTVTAGMNNIIPGTPRTLVATLTTKF